MNRLTLWNISTGQVHSPLLWKFGRFYFNQHEVRTNTFLNGDSELEQPTAGIILNFFAVKSEWVKGYTLVTVIFW